MWLISDFLNREGGMFVAEMEFPEDYPNLPPKLTFRTKMWHPSSMCSRLLRSYILLSPPNLLSYRYFVIVYDNGGVCISILVRHLDYLYRCINEFSHSIPQRWTNMGLRM